VGGILGAILLWCTFSSSPLYSRTTTGLGTDGWGAASHIRINEGGAFLAEVVLTAFFVFVLLGVTSKIGNAATVGMVIGLSLTVVHLIGIPVTRTSVNPARSLGPALIVGGTALHLVWPFLVAPLVGGILAAGLHLLVYPRAPSPRYCSRVRARLVAVVTAGALGLAACSAGTTDNASGTSTSASSASPTTIAPTTTSAPTSDLAVTDAIRSQLVAAGAALNSLPPSDYTGLRPGETYYAYDGATQTYWAGGALSPSPASTPAQVAAQDDGAYLLFERPQGRVWKAFDVGLAGTAEGSPCPVTVPTPILNLWGWDPGSCRPTTIS